MVTFSSSLTYIGRISFTLIATRTNIIEMEERSLRRYYSEILLLGCYLVTLLWISSCKVVNNNSESPALCVVSFLAATEESDLMRSIWGIFLMPTKSQETKRLIIYFLNIAERSFWKIILMDSLSGGF